MLWVLNGTVSIRRFFWAPKTYVKTDGQENNHTFTLENFAVKILSSELACSATETS